MKTRNFTFILLSAALFASCGGSSETKTETVKAAQKVRVEEVKFVDVDQLASFTASIEAEAVNNIAPAMPGRIRRINVDVGSVVGRGQALVTMDGATYSQQQTQVATLKTDYERYKELYAVGGISQQQLDQVKAQLDVAQAALSNLGENTTLTSPISGVVTARNFDPGDVATGLPILTIQNIRTVKVKVNVSESYYRNVVKGMPAKVQIDALGDEVFEGKVALIHPTLDAVSHTFPVEIEVKNSDSRIRPGMFARVTMNFGTESHPVIPDMAVLKQSGTNTRYVFVENGGKVTYTIVELGRRMDDKYEIVSGLKSGDKVVVNGNANLIDGAEVEVVQ
ncbi:efflux RND transporter periplasmic adaptor subunit [Petrimonas sp.]|uniref:efflux RND transporter periplasmic adaptor subunit n=1 Tax=Petrimonas sp. TaxID=2023866 RepID=UPI003F519C60